uniref:Coilin p80 n=1 Tax=Cyprinus carpio TaxID=7962 RepID=A0A8C2BNS1_CYPCA
MATSSLNTVRVRLYFDYPPPATPECRMCWLLVDLNKCRVVADLSSIIKEKFGYSRRTILDLFIEDCYLPPTESIYIVRDNDSIRVKVSSAVYINGEVVYQNTEEYNSKTKKRGREGETQISEGLSKKKKREDAQINGSAPAEDAKKKKKKKKKKKEVKESATTQKNTETPSSTKNNRKGVTAAPTSDKTIRARTQQPKSSSSESSEDESHNKAPPPKPKPNTSSSDDTEKPKSNVPVQSLPVTPKLSSKTSKLPLQTPQRRESSTDSSSSSSSSPSQARTTAKKSQVTTPPSSATAQSVSSSVSKEPQDKAESSDSEASEIELVIKKPNLQGMGLKIAGVSPGVSEAAGRDRGHTRGQERGRGRGANRGSGRGGFGRAKGTPWKQDFHHNYENGERQKQNDSLTNESFILQLLELTENYTPEVSDYKEGKIIAFNPQTKVLELELLSQPQASAEPGKFDLVYQNPDGSESVEYAVTHGSQLTERWDSLLEPRLIVENVG